MTAYFLAGFYPSFPSSLSAEHETNTERPTDLMSICDPGASSQHIGVTLPGFKGGQIETVAFLDSGAIGQQANLVSRRFLREELGDPPVTDARRSLQTLGRTTVEICGEIELKIWPRSRNERTGCMELEPPINQRFMVVEAVEGREHSDFGDILLGQGYMARRGRSINFSYVINSKKTSAQRQSTVMATIDRQQFQEQFDRSQLQTQSVTFNSVQAQSTTVQTTVPTSNTDPATTTTNTG